MVVGGCHTGGRHFHSRLPCSGACQRAGPSSQPARPRRDIPRSQEAAALVLALCSLLLGLFPWGDYLSMPGGSPPNPLTPKALSSVVWTILAGGVVAIFRGPLGTPDGAAALGERLFIWASPLAMWPSPWRKCLSGSMASPDNGPWQGLPSCAGERSSALSCGLADAGIRPRRQQAQSTTQPGPAEWNLRMIILSRRSHGREGQRQEEGPGPESPIVAIRI